jgi:acyl-CoA thioester hydrolase
MSKRPQPHNRRPFRHFLPISKRWMDDDAYAHAGNVVDESLIDSAGNEFAVRSGVLDIGRGEVIGLAAETRCRFCRPIARPQPVGAGLRVAHLGSSSVRCEVGIVADGHDTAGARGRLLRVDVMRAERRPVNLSAGLRRALERIAA